MWTLFKVIRWIITGLALWWLCGVVFEEGTTADGAVFGLMLFGQLVFWPLRCCGVCRGCSVAERPN